MMLAGLVSLFVAWVLHFVGLEDFISSLTGMTEHQYYITFFATGMITWLSSQANNNTDE